MNAESTVVFDRILSAVLNGTVQGALLASTLWLALRVLPRTNAATRHALGLAYLVLAALLPMGYFFGHQQAATELPSSRLKPALIPAEKENPPANVQSEAMMEGLPEAPGFVLSVLPASRRQKWRERIGSAASSPRVHRNGALCQRDAGSTLSRYAPGSEESLEEMTSSGQGTVVEPSDEEEAYASVPMDSEERFYLSTPLNLPFSLPRYAGAILVGLWLVLAAARLVRLGMQCWTLRSLKHHSPSASMKTCELFSRLCRELEVRRTPQLCISSEIHSPMAVGFRKPAILLPSALVDRGNEARLEPILRHELAHIVRRDDWSNLLQQLVHALFFFHPGVRWLSRRLTIDREIACDDHVLTAMGGRKEYALLLAEFAKPARGREWVAAPAAWGSESQLKQRINMILDSKRNASPRLARARTGLLATAAAVLAIVSLQTMPRLAFAQAPPEAQLAEPAAADAVVAPPTPPAAPAGPASPNSNAELEETGPRFKPGARALAPPVEFGGKAAPYPRPGKVPQLRAAAGPLALAQAPLGELPGDNNSAPAPKRRARAVDDSIERRLDRLEKMVESLVKAGPDKNNFQFDFGEKMKPGFNPEEFARTMEKVAREAEKAGRDAQRTVEEMQRRGDFERFSKFGEKFGEEFDRGKDELKAHRKVLEQQRQALEKQIHALERQIQQLERVEERVEEERSRDEDGARDEKRRARENEKREREKEKKEKEKEIDKEEGTRK